MLQIFFSVHYSSAPDPFYGLSPYRLGMNKNLLCNAIEAIEEFQNLSLFYDP
jgi:hypothetical protein